MPLALTRRRAVALEGLVQGVGFRPYVHGLAARLGLGGFVRNHASGVWIEVEGGTDALNRFLAVLPLEAPPLARVDTLRWEPRTPVGDRGFRIEPSESVSSGRVFISADVATCPACLAELLDPRDRRYRYPFLNCTNCGPRLTVVTGAPYDRVRTTMAGFDMCAACRAEYDDPSNRRFHAQPTACPACGPHLRVADRVGRPVATGDPLAAFAATIRDGGVGAVKGLGGYHLVCDARNEAAVRELRRRKQRDEKPFAIMLPDLDAVAALCEVSSSERALLSSSRRPIVLLARRAPGAVASEVAPGSPSLGVMLPYTPLHELLVREVDGIPLVMTSGNRSDEPIAYREPEAFDRLGRIADRFLTHDRPISVRCDDSVVRLVSGSALPIRRSRGEAPGPLDLPVACRRPILAMGGQLKATFALGRGAHAFPSHHIGDLEHYDAYRAYVAEIALYRRLFDVSPELIVHDLHPDYASTHHAIDLARGEGLERLAVQHHHAHMAGCMAEHGLPGPAIGVTLDGTGFGTDGTVWGGEFLIGGYREVRRAAHLRSVPMPGGARAIREPWRMAVAYLDATGSVPSSVLDRLSRGVGRSAVRVVRQMLARAVNAPQTSSAGRLFDAVAALAGVRYVVSYEGQAALELEWLAETLEPDGTYPFDLVERQAVRPGPIAPGDPTLVIDTLPLVVAAGQDVERGVSAGRISRRFHSTLTEIVASVCGKLGAISGIDVVVLSGGVFQNALLVREVMARLRSDGFRVCRHRLVPPNDGGLSFGQLAVAAALTHDTGQPGE